MEAEADRLLEEYDATSAVKLVMTFFDEDVSKWYVRQSRHRFYEVEDADNRAAFATLHEIIAVTCRLLAPFAPFITDWVHRELCGSSVHLAPFPREAAGKERSRGWSVRWGTFGRWLRWAARPARKPASK